MRTVEELQDYLYSMATGSNVESSAMTGHQYHCDTCGTDLSRRVVRIRCGECRDFDLCLACFTKGEEKGDHVWTHQYIAIGGRNLPLFHQDWTALEEFVLVESVSRVGFGNWVDVADSVGVGGTPGGHVKRPEDCEEHYTKLYLNSRNSIPNLRNLFLPLESPPWGVNTIFFEKKGSSDVLKGWTKLETLIETDEIKPIEDVTKTEETPQDTKAGVSRQVSIRLSSSGKEPPPKGASIQGCLPYRGELEEEYDPSAEHMIADIQISLAEDPIDIDLKLMQISSYNVRLRERTRRRVTLMDKTTLDLRRHKTFPNVTTKGDKKSALLTYHFASYLTEDEHISYIKSLMDERQICKRLNYLREWQQMGLKTLDDILKYELQCHNLQMKGAQGMERHTIEEIFTPEEIQLMKYWELECRTGNNSIITETYTDNKLFSEPTVSLVHIAMQHQEKDKDNYYEFEDGLEMVPEAQPKDITKEEKDDVNQTPANNSNGIDSPLSTLYQQGIENDKIVQSNCTADNFSLLTPLKLVTDESQNNTESLDDTKYITGDEFLNKVEDDFCKKLGISPLQFALVRVLVSKEAIKWTTCDDDDVEYNKLLKKIDLNKGVLKNVIESNILIPKPQDSPDVLNGRNFHRKRKKARKKKGKIDLSVGISLNQKSEET